MQFKINNASERAIYQQIIDQVKRDIALGRVKTAEKLPTVRDLAAELVINPNTISKAYRQLEKEGIIITRPGTGTFVAELSSNLSRAVQKKILCEMMELMLVEAIHMQIDRKTLVEWFENLLERFKFGSKDRKKNA